MAIAPRDDARARTAIGRDFGDFAAVDVAVLGVLHLEPRREIDPELKAVQQSLGLLRHLRVNDAAAGGHPLRAAGDDLAAVAHVVLVAHAALEQVGERLEAPVRMGRKAGNVVVRVVGADLVEHEKRIEALHAARRRRPALSSRRRHRWWPRRGWPS